MCCCDTAISRVTTVRLYIEDLLEGKEMNQISPVQRKTDKRDANKNKKTNFKSKDCMFKITFYALLSSLFFFTSLFTSSFPLISLQFLSRRRVFDSLFFSLTLSISGKKRGNSLSLSNSCSLTVLEPREFERTSYAKATQE